jgi:hypothetical protein
MQDKIEITVNTNVTGFDVQKTVVLSLDALNDIVSQAVGVILAYRYNGHRDGGESNVRDAIEELEEVLETYGLVDDD